MEDSACRQASFAYGTILYHIFALNPAVGVMCPMFGLSTTLRRDFIAKDEHDD